MFDLQDAARGYAKAAERVLGEDADFLNSNSEVIPVFVSLLFQSIEISLKHIGIEGKLFSVKESRSKSLRNGHGIREIADLVNARLGAHKDYPVIMALTAGIEDSRTATVTNRMIYGDEFKKTRRAYQSRNLGYAEVASGDFAVIEGLKDWVLSVNRVASNLPQATQIISKWKQSASTSQTFAIWYR